MHNFKQIGFKIHKTLTEQNDEWIKIVFMI
jgi:hypothetical protein